MATLIDSDLLTAIATPFDENNEINFDVLEKLVNRLINLGCNGFVVGGTTGETPTCTNYTIIFDLGCACCLQCFQPICCEKCSGACANA